MQALNLAHMAMQELERARSLYPDWPTNLIEATAIMVEEATEVLKAANNLHHRQHEGTALEVRKEIIQTMAMCMRLYLDTKALAEVNNG